VKDDGKLCHAQFGVDKATAENYIETYDGMKTVAASMTPVLGVRQLIKSVH
jgi:hypothetical protein